MSFTSRPKSEAASFSVILKITTLLLGSLFFFIRCSNSQTTSEKFNFDFEKWDESFLSEDSSVSVTDYVDDPYVGTAEYWVPYGASAIRTTDAYTGKYAMVVNNWYGTGAGIVRLSDCKNSRKFRECLAPLSKPPTVLKGHYKLVSGATQENADLIGRINIYFLDFNNSSSIPDTVGTGEVELLPEKEYQAFSFSISYPESNINIDSVELTVTVEGSDCSIGKCNFLFIDDLEFQFDSTITALNNTKAHNQQFEVFPNPFSNSLSIKIPSAGIIQLFDFSGKEVFRQVTTSSIIQKIDLTPDMLKQGIYFLTLIKDDRSFITQKIIHRQF